MVERVENLSTQEAYNLACKHLITQGRKSVNDEDKCVYRDGIIDGKVQMCAVGCLIPDELYEPSMDEEDIVVHTSEIDRVPSYLESDLLGKYHRLKEYFKYVDRNLLNSLQRLHDGQPEWCWKEKLKAIGAEYKLEIPSCLE